MIHAYLSLEGIRDRGDHGPKFHKVMDAINSSHTPGERAHEDCRLRGLCCLKRRMAVAGVG